MKLILHHEGRLAYSRAFTFVVESFADMLRTKVAHPCLDWGNQSEVIYAMDEDIDRVVAAHVFYEDHQTGRIVSPLVYVLPGYRGRGIAVETFGYLERLVSSRPGVVVIYSSCVEDNEPIKSTFAKAGHDQSAIRYVKWLKDVTQK